jgi:hypothetical protein
MILRYGCLSGFMLITIENIHNEKQPKITATTAGAILILLGAIMRIL